MPDCDTCPVTTFFMGAYRFGAAIDGIPVWDSLGRSRQWTKPRRARDAVCSRVHEFRRRG